MGCQLRKEWRGMLCISNRSKFWWLFVVRPTPVQCVIEKGREKGWSSSCTRCLGNGHFRCCLVRVCIQVDGLNNVTLATAVADQVAEVLQGNLALTAYLQCLISSGAKLLNRASEFNPKVVSRESQDLADFAGDACAVQMDIVNGSKLRRDLAGDSLRQ